MAWEETYGNYTPSQPGVSPAFVERYQQVANAGYEPQVTDFYMLCRLGKRRLGYIP